jgi:hypothetical protein
MYSTYCANQPRALSCLEEAKKSNKAFRVFLEETVKNTRCRGLNLFSFLIAPVQRICKYPLLFRDLLRNTAEDHADFGPVTAALSQIEGVVEYVNEAKRTAEQLQRIVDIQSCIEGLDDLVEPGERSFSALLVFLYVLLYCFIPSRFFSVPSSFPPSSSSSSHLPVSSALF